MRLTRPSRRALFPALFLFAVGLLTTGGAAAGPVVTITFDDGRSERAEILGFDRGMFRFRDSATAREFEAPAARIKVLDFGERPQVLRPTPPARPEPEVGPANLAALRRIAESRRYLMLMLAVLNTVRTKGAEVAIRFRDSLHRELSSPDLSADRRRDLSLALVATHYGLLERSKGDALLRRTVEEYPNDPEVKRFVGALKEFRHRALLRLETRPQGKGRTRGPNEPVR